jgi:hypothetical protein
MTAYVNVSVYWYYMIKRVVPPIVTVLLLSLTAGWCVLLMRGASWLAWNRPAITGRRYMPTLSQTVCHPYVCQTNHMSRNSQ